MALLVATNGEAEVPLGVAWLGTGEARLGGAAAPLGEADEFESVAVSCSSLTVKSVVRSCNTTRPTAAIPVPKGTGLLLEASACALLEDFLLPFVEVDMFVLMKSRREPRGILQLIVAGVV